MHTLLWILAGTGGYIMYDRWQHEPSKRAAETVLPPQEKKNAGLVRATIGRPQVFVPNGVLTSAFNNYYNPTTDVPEELAVDHLKSLNVMRKFVYG